VYKPLHPGIPQCTATSKSTGRRCENPAVRGFNVCRLHGAHKKKKPGDPPKKTTNALKSNVHRKYKNRIEMAAEEIGTELLEELKHGFLAFEILNGEERRDFLGVVKQMHEDFKMNKSSDFYAVELVATNLVLYRRAAKNGDVKAAEAYDRMVRLHLSDLKATKNAREGDTVNIKTTPAEWAAALLKRVDEEDKENEGEQADQADQAGEAGGDGALSGAFSGERESSVTVYEDEAAKNSDETKTSDP